MTEDKRVADDTDIVALEEWATLPWANTGLRHELRFVRAAVCRVINRLKVAEEERDLLADSMSYFSRANRGLFSIYGPTALARDAFEVVDRLYPDKARDIQKSHENINPGEN